MNDNDLRNNSMDDYGRLMAEAYPFPKKDIHAAVMTRIMEEAEHPRKKAKILTPAFRKRFVKYGSIAACFVLLVTLGFRIIPMMTKDAAMESAVNTSAPQMADTESAYTDETHAAAEGGSGFFKAKLSGTAPAAPAEEPAEEEIVEEPYAAAVYSASLTDTVTEDEAAVEVEEVEEAAAEEAPAAPETPMLMMSPKPSADEAVVEEAPAEDYVVAEEEVEECIVEEAVVEEAAAEEAAPQSGTVSFESELKLALTGEIGAEAYTAWLTARSYTSAEDWSIAEFVQYFAIPRERFTELYDALTAFYAQTAPDTEIISYNLDELYPN